MSNVNLFTLYTAYTLGDRQQDLVKQADFEKAALIAGLGRLAGRGLGATARVAALPARAVGWAADKLSQATRYLRKLPRNIQAGGIRMMRRTRDAYNAMAAAAGNEARAMAGMRPLGGGIRPSITPRPAPAPVAAAPAAGGGNAASAAGRGAAPAAAPKPVAQPGQPPVTKPVNTTIASGSGLPGNQAQTATQAAENAANKVENAAARVGIGNLKPWQVAALSGGAGYAAGKWG